MPEMNESLESKFGKPGKPAASKAERLAGGLGPKPRVRQQPASESPASPVAPVQPVEEQRAPVSEQADLPRNTSVSLSREVFQRVRKAATSQGLGNTELFAQAYQQVGQKALNERFGAADEAEGDGFPLLGAPRRRLSGGSVQMQLRLTDRQRKWLDEKKDEAAAPSRSAFVEAVFEMGLGLS